MLFVYDPVTLEKLYVISRMTSVQWTERFYGVGGFEMHFDREYDCLAQGNIVAYKGKFGKIEKLYKSDEDIYIKGYDLKGFLNQRYCISREFTDTNIETIFKTLIDENMISAEDSDRNIEKMTCADNQNRGSVIEHMVDKTRLADTFETLGTEYEVGSKIDIADGCYRFDVIIGTDRSKDIIFCRNFHNIDDVNYCYDYLNAVNIVYSQEEITDEDGNGTDEYNTLSKGKGVGINRYEGYTSRSDEMSEYLTENAPAETLTGSITDAVSQKKYGTDYFLGDYVTVRFGNMSTVKQITEVRHTAEKSRNKISIIFGTEKKNPIKKMLKGG